MRIVFFGTPQFAADILGDIAPMLSIECVYTQPDRVRSRGKKLLPSPVKLVGEELGIPVRTPATLKDEEVIDELEALRPDLICVAAYGALLPARVLSIPTYGCINVHASLLPAYRGAAPIERAILNGEEEVGICIMRMEEGLDTGEWCIRRAIPVRDMGAEELTAELASLGSSALLSAIAQIESDAVRWTAQDETKATYAPKIGKGELDLDPSASVIQNVRRIQASSAAHPARAHIAGRDVTIMKATPAQKEHPSAKQDGIAHALVAEGRLYLFCSDGALEVLSLKPAGKGSMSAQAFISGLRDRDEQGFTQCRAI